MTPWLNLLISALDQEFETHPRMATMAAVDAENRPRARSVVVRKIAENGSLWITSDARSDKGCQFRHQPWTELVFWLTGSRQQFRVAGRVEIAVLQDPNRAVAWRELSDSARALFLWPSPGDPRDSEEFLFPRKIGMEIEIPAIFDLLIVQPDRVELLDLTEHPHRRVRWNAEQDWSGEVLNP